MSIINCNFTTSKIENVAHSFARATTRLIDPITQKTNDFVNSPIGRGMIGLGLGFGMYMIYAPLTDRVIRALGFLPTVSDPFSSLNVVSKILCAPLVCIIAPISEEILFRGSLQDKVQLKLINVYLNLGLSSSNANHAARMTSILLTSIIFGLSHFTNAVIFWCNPMLFLPQVVAATIMGILFSFAKELTGDLFMPIGMHMGNNILAWTELL